MATAKQSPSTFEVIAVGDVVKSPRGRKAVLDPTLCEAFAQITTEEQAIRLSGLGPFTDKDSRAAFSTVVRKNWASVHPTRRPKINYGLDGVAQVQMGKPIVKA